jgi:5-methylcytosine-specific restriction endonuclease McrA
VIRPPIAGQAEAQARAKEIRRGQDALRREHDQYRHLYGLAAWNSPRYGLRIWKLNENPLCEAKERDGSDCRSAATEVHHIKDHKGNVDLFFDRKNLQSLCKPHHSEETARRVQAALKEAANGI